MNRVIYVVMGATGEYSDNREWAVMAHETKEESDDYVRRLDEWCLAHGIKDGGYQIAGVKERLDYDEREALRGQNPLDPNMDVDYTGVRYWNIAVPLAANLSERLSVTRTARVVELET